MSYGKYSTEEMTALAGEDILLKAQISMRNELIDIRLDMMTNRNTNALNRVVKLINELDEDIKMCTKSVQQFTWNLR